MDMFMLKLSTKFMKGAVAKVLSKSICKKLGYKIDIQLNDIRIDNVDGDVKFHIDVDGKMNKTEFKRLMEDLNED